MTTKVRTVYVDACYGCDVNGDGSPNAPFRTPEWAQLHTTPDDKLMYFVPLGKPEVHRKLPWSLILWGLVASAFIALAVLVGRK